MRSVAERGAAVGRLPLAHALPIRVPPTAVATTAVRVKDLLYCRALAPGVSFTGPLLLVDNTIRTRWTATVAAALLADAGATSVLPLAIHQLP
jgi:ATP-dependent DNA helicase RecQ